ncbi:hypothetical protein GEMRC1_002805 [Eukaryota sp. GEM-RC1]
MTDTSRHLLSVPLGNSLKSGKISSLSKPHVSKLIESFVNRQNVLQESQNRVKATLSAFDDVSSICLADLDLSSSPNSCSVTDYATSTSNRIQHILDSSSSSLSTRLELLSSLDTWFSTLQNPVEKKEASESINTEEFLSLITSTQQSTLEKTAKIDVLHKTLREQLLEKTRRQIREAKEALEASLLYCIDLSHMIELGRVEKIQGQKDLEKAQKRSRIWRLLLKLQSRNMRS